MFNKFSYGLSRVAVIIGGSAIGLIVLIGIVFVVSTQRSTDLANPSSEQDSTNLNPSSEVASTNKEDVPMSLVNVGLVTPGVAAGTPSPTDSADMYITDPKSRRVGRDFDFGSEYEQIEGSFYSGYKKTNNEQIAVNNPDDGKYLIFIKGTSGGSYYLGVSYLIDEIGYREGEVSGKINAGEVIKYSFIIQRDSTVGEGTLELIKEN